MKTNQVGMGWSLCGQQSFHAHFPFKYYTIPTGFNLRVVHSWRMFFPEVAQLLKNREVASKCLSQWSWAILLFKEFPVKDLRGKSTFKGEIILQALMFWSLSEEQEYKPYHYGSVKLHGALTSNELAMQLLQSAPEKVYFTIESPDQCCTSNSPSWVWPQLNSTSLSWKGISYF